MTSPLRARCARTTSATSATGTSPSSATAPGIYERHAGYTERTLAEFAERAGQRGLRFLHRPCEGTYESTAQAVDRIFAERPGTTGFVVQNEGATSVSGPSRELGRDTTRGFSTHQPTPPTASLKGLMLSTGLLSF